MRLARTFIIALVLLSGGCGVPDGSSGDPTSATTSATLPTELTWEEQLAAVRDGTSQRIAVSQHTVSREQWREIAEGCETLQRLEIDAGEFSDDDLDVLTSLPQLVQLKLGAEVGDAGVARIARVETLEFLNLPEGRFHDESLALLTGLPTLKQLRFHSPHVTDEGLKHIAAMPSLRYLHIIACPITAAGLRHLHSMTELQSFYLDGCDIEDEAIYELLRALPSLHFHRDQLHLPDDPHTHE